MEIDLAGRHSGRCEVMKPPTTEAKQGKARQSTEVAHGNEKCNGVISESHITHDVTYVTSEWGGCAAQTHNADPVRWTTDVGRTVR